MSEPSGISVRGLELTKDEVALILEQYCRDRRIRMVTDELWEDLASQLAHYRLGGK